MAQTLVSSTTTDYGTYTATVNVYSDGSTGTQIDWKAGTPEYNAQQIQAALQSAVTFFGGNYTNWSTLSNAQKDNNHKQATRALAQICRWLLNQFDSAG